PRHPFLNDEVWLTVLECHDNAARLALGIDGDPVDDNARGAQERQCTLALLVPPDPTEQATFGPQLSGVKCHVGGAAPESSLIRKEIPQYLTKRHDTGLAHRFLRP